MMKMWKLRLVGSENEQFYYSIEAKVILCLERAGQIAQLEWKM